MAAFQMDEMDGVVTFENVVTVAEELEPYLLSFYPGPQEDGLIECFAVCLLKRQGGPLLALPQGVLPGEITDAGNAEGADGMFGPSVELEVGSVIMDNGTISPTGERMHVLVVDCTDLIVHHLSLPGPMEDVDYGFDPDQPYALPSPQEITIKATAWISNASPVPPFTQQSPAHHRPERTKRQAKGGDQRLEKVCLWATQSGPQSPKRRAPPRDRPMPASPQP